MVERFKTKFDKKNWKITNFYVGYVVSSNKILIFEEQNWLYFRMLFDQNTY